MSATSISPARLRLALLTVLVEVAIVFGTVLTLRMGGGAEVLILLFKVLCFGVLVTGKPAPLRVGGPRFARISAESLAEYSALLAKFRFFQSSPLILLCVVL